MGKVKVAKILLIISALGTIFTGIYLLIMPTLLEKIVQLVAGEAYDVRSAYYSVFDAELIHTVGVVVLVGGILTIVPMIMSFFIKTRTMLIITGVLAIVFGVVSGISSLSIVAGILLLASNKYYI